MRWGDFFDALQVEAESLEILLCSSEIWNDRTKMQELTAKKKQLEQKINSYQVLNRLYDDAYTLATLALEGCDCDDELLNEVVDLKSKFCSKFEEVTIATTLTGEYDKNNAIITLHAGAGGTESCDWAAMLLRMYTRWASTHDFKFNIMDYQAGEEVGVKSVTAEVIGDNAFGYLKSEKGVHRLIRISPFDSNKRRHTSFASCEIIPEIENDTEIKILPEELRVDTYRSSGAGGQHVNTTDSAIRITHLPTGIVVQCQNERSQMQNREFAMRMLQSKLITLKLNEQEEKLRGIRGEQKEIAWGNQIRTYVFHPYNLVKDHRTNTETGNVQAVMNGEIDLFINAFLTSQNNNVI